ncbi:unnamed protein product [Thlaspi arvense]|uniref:Uncharacterized protein n=1 Tax=Thlaspi arvense TaxID=13288 RepID=A0AAU9SZ16_THLAR|nr:unnamed protein product [Thlaspi arvense]
MDRRWMGKQFPGTDSTSSGGKKRKGGVECRDEGLGISKRKPPAFPQLFEKSAEAGYFGGSSDEYCVSSFSLQFLRLAHSENLSSWGVIPSKFTPAEHKEPGDMEWISEMYGEEKKKKILPDGSVGGNGEGSSGSTSEISYELYNLVCFSRKDFGLIVGVDDKGDGYKVLKEGSDGPAVVRVQKKEMQSGPFDSKFTALDLNNKQISTNDVVKISKGPSEGKQAVVKQIYKSIVFLYAESEEENGGYLCCRSQSCEKINLFTDESNENTGGFDASAFGDSASCLKSPLPPEKEWQPKENYINSNQGDKGSMYSIGQKLRIRVGPLKGYLCRVIALRYSDVTVKLDSQPKILTVKSEHLAEVRDTNMPSKSGKPTSTPFANSNHKQHPGDGYDSISGGGQLCAGSRIVTSDSNDGFSVPKSRKRAKQRGSRSAVTSDSSSVDAKNSPPKIGVEAFIDLETVIISVD